METISIGLSVKELEQMANKLNYLLADYQLFYMNVKGFHWNILGESFPNCTSNSRSCTTI